MKIGLALSGGGVLGAAHIGLLEQIERSNIEVEMICGTSSGAIVGALFANGGTKKIAQFIDDLNSEGLFTKKGIIQSLSADRIFETVKLTLQKNLTTDDFANLPKKFMCVGTDIIEGERVVFEDGSLIASIMASAAYPGVFPVQNIGDKYFIDGGITSNLPAAPLREKEMDFVIGSSLYSVAKFERLDDKGNLKSNRVLTAIRSVDIMQKSLADFEMMAYCDYCFMPPIHSYRWYHFDRINEIIEEGQKYAHKKMPELKKTINEYKRKHFIKNIFEEISN